jgi:broad specificity phosphatase PhoE
MRCIQGLAGLIVKNKTAVNSHKDIDFDSVFCSPSVRAVQTAKIAFPSTPLTFCDELKVWDYGRTLEGKTVQEIRQDIPQWTLFPE